MLSEKDIRNSTAKIEKAVAELKDANQRFEDFLRKNRSAEERILSSFNAILLKEAKRIISESSSAEIKNYLGKTETDLSLAANLLCGEGIVSYDAVRSELDPLLEDLKKYQKGKRLIEKVYTPGNKKIVEDTISKANEACASSLQWFFKTQKERKEITEAVNLLFRLIETNYISTSSRLYESENDESFDDAWKIEELNRITKGRVFEEEDPERPSFVQMNQKLKELIQSGSGSLSAEKSYAQLRKELQGNAALLKKSEVDAMLSNVEVDELNRNREGIRISALKDAGIKTVLDVLKESVYKLSSLNGISEEMASKIKTNATAIADNVTSAATLKLSRDNRDDLSDEVVKLLHSYISEKKNIELSDEVSAVLNRVYSTLTDRTLAKNAIEWFTSSFDNRSRTLSAIKEISELSCDELSLKAKKVAEDFRGAESKAEEAWDFFERNAAECYSTLENLVPGLFKGNDTYYGLPEKLAREVADENIFPNGLLCTLRRYQEWGVKYILHQKKVLLGDEMGLGKTVQAIATMVSLRNTGASHFLVVCPASVVINWCREVEKHSLLKVIKIHGSDREICLKEWIEKGGVGVTTFETTSRIALPEDFTYSLLVVDEAHYIKNPSAKRTQNVLSIARKAERELFMTGTALENNIDEMIELVGDLKPELVSEIKRMRYMATADSFREKIASVYYRRKREDVLGELPDLIEAEEWCSLMDEEKKLYHKAVLSAKQSEVRRVSWNVDNLELSCKANRLKEIVEEAERDGRKVIVFSFFLDTIAKIKDYLGERCLMPITGALNPSKRQELIDEFEKDPTKSVLIAQIQAGGTGLNIQSASVVVITEPQWKPSTENQAISRAYRMGQSRSVLVYRLLCEKTADEKVIKRLKEKQEIFDAFADKAEAVKEVEIDESTYSDIIKEEIERIKKEQDEE